MPTDDPRISALNSALYHLQPPQTPYSTPFTYNNGLTVLEILDRIRQAVIDTITYAESFGKEVEGMVKKINETADKWAKDSKDKLDQFESFLNDSRQSTEAKINAMNTLIEEFKAKLIQTAITPMTVTYNGQRIDKGGLSHRMMNGDSYTALTTNVMYEIESHIKAVETKVRNDFYSKTESDNRYLLNNHRDHVVFIGSSNGTTDGGKWLNDVARDMGMTPHNHCIGGGAFTSALGARFSTQLNNAYAELTKAGLNDRVGAVVFVDMLNDIRAMANVQNEAQGCADFVLRTWPYAKVYCIPVIWNDSSLNSGKMSESITSRISEFSWAFEKMQPAVCEGSRSWFHGDTSVIRGSDEVHLTDAGYQTARNLFMSWYNGGSGWQNYGWRNLGAYGTDANGVQQSTMTLRIQRQGDTVYLRGWFKMLQTLGADHPFWSIPRWATPFSNQYFQIMRSDQTWRTAYVNTASQLVASGLGAGEEYYAFATWQVL